MSACGSPLSLNSRIEPAVAVKDNDRPARSTVCWVVESGGSRCCSAAAGLAGVSAARRPDWVCVDGPLFCALGEADGVGDGNASWPNAAPTSDNATRAAAHRDGREAFDAKVMQPLPAYRDQPCEQPRAWQRGPWASAISSRKLRRVGVQLAACRDHHCGIAVARIRLQ